MKDLVVLAACKDIQVAVQEILSQHQRTGIRPVTFDVRVFASGHDAGCYQRAHEILRTQLGQFEHALVVFDHDGSGAESKSPEDVESEVGRRLAQVGWRDKAAAVVIAPEVEVWAFSDSPHVEAALGWSGRTPGLWSWLVAEGFVQRRGLKPGKPKQALNAALRSAKRAHSPAVLGAIARSVSFDRCSDRAFTRLLRILQGWFAPQGN